MAWTRKAEFAMLRVFSEESEICLLDRQLLMVLEEEQVRGVGIWDLGWVVY